MTIHKVDQHTVGVRESIGLAAGFGFILAIGIVGFLIQ